MQKITNPVDIAKLRGAVQEAVDSLTRADAESDLRKDISSRMKEELEIPVKDFNALVKMMHKQNMNEEAERIENLIEMCSTLSSKNADVEAGGNE